MLTFVGVVGLVGLVNVKETWGLPIEDIIEELK